MKVAVLGCGPAGLMAVQGAAMSGADDIVCYSQKKQSTIGGAQYLHQHIPGITPEHHEDIITFAKTGDKETYAEKVYGDRNAQTSWDKFMIGQFPAWSLQSAYQKLWDMYSHLVRDEIIVPAHIPPMTKEYDLVLSTIPAKLLCVRQHKFEVAEVVMWPSAMLSSAADNLVLYNGRPEDSWYRTCRIFGHEWTEWRKDMGPDKGDPPVVFGTKPLRTDCNCWVQVENFHRLGRFGQWKKGVLTHEAFNEAERIMVGARALH